MRLMRAFILVVGIIAIAVAVHVENLAALYAAVVGGILIEVTFEAMKSRPASVRIAPSYRRPWPPAASTRASSSSPSWTACPATSPSSPR
jgi:hypothetical protein